MTHIKVIFKNYKTGWAFNPAFCNNKLVMKIFKISLTKENDGDILYIDISTLSK
jgi:hypothetical protein